mgnify:CR=1 FL=1
MRVAHLVVVEDFNEVLGRGSKAVALGPFAPVEKLGLLGREAFRNRIVS